MTKPVFIRGIGQGAKFIVVLIALVLIFKEQMTALVEKIFETISTQSGKVMK